MKIKTLVSIFLVVFVGFCGYLMYEASAGVNVVHDSGDKAIGLVSTTEAQIDEDAFNKAVEEAVEPELPPVDPRFDVSKFAGSHGSAKNETRTLGSINTEEGYNFKIELTPKGAAVSSVVLSGYDDGDRKAPQALVLLAPIDVRGQQMFSLASKSFKLSNTDRYSGSFPVNKVRWNATEVVTDADGKQSVEFSIVLKNGAGEEAVKLIKVYSIAKDSYDLSCAMSVENLLDTRVNTSFGIVGPIGIEREGTRSDMRKLVGGFVGDNDQIVSSAIDINKLRKAKESGDRDKLSLREKLAKGQRNSAKFSWAASTSKYFAAILHPQTEGSTIVGLADYYDPGLSDKADGDEHIGFSLKTNTIAVGAAGEADAVKTLDFMMYLGPKDQKVFKGNDLYAKLGFIHTISFLACCCPGWFINPLAFGIMKTMAMMFAWMGPLGNYGVVIMVFVVLVRLGLHPVTRKSQISMMKMQKLGPKAEEIKKRYANNKQEMNKRVMQLYKDENVSPMMGMLPMMLQMPIWIALYSAIYANIDLRGQGFLPFWITDLSAPDILIPFTTGFTIPLINIPITSFNLLPILLAVAMFLQQKLMPHSSGQQNSQVAQQQKMMMIMMPIMMLLFLYNAPSALNLYIMASTFSSVAEQIIIRKHIREKEELENKGLVAVTSKTGGKVKKKKPKLF